MFTVDVKQQCNNATTTGVSCVKDFGMWRLCYKNRLKKSSMVYASQLLEDISRMFILHGHRTWPRGYKTFFMLNSVDHEINLNAHKYKDIKKFGFF